jgi:hypothetical protein
MNVNSEINEYVVMHVVFWKELRQSQAFLSLII